MSFKKTALCAAVMSTMFTVPAFAQTTFAGNTDIALAENVHHAIESRPALSGNQIRVRAVGGTVYLTGSVDTTMEAATAETIAQSVQGVQKVVNSTSVIASGN